MMQAVSIPHSWSAYQAYWTTLRQLADRNKWIILDIGCTNSPATAVEFGALALAPTGESLSDSTEAKLLTLILRTTTRGIMTARNPTHPSVSLQTGLDELGWSVEEFADNLGVCRETIDQLMDGQCGISPIVALALQRIGWSDADFWMRRQANYDLAQARREPEAKSGVAD